MKTQNTTTAVISSRRLPARPIDSEKALASSKNEGPPDSTPVAVDRSGHPLGWIERTLLAVDTDRLFIELSDPQLREDLVATYEEEGWNVIAASNSRTLLSFMEHLPLPREFGHDVVIAEDDFPGTNAEDLHRQLLARGWSIPVFTVSTQAPWGKTGAAS